MPAEFFTANPVPAVTETKKLFVVELFVTPLAVTVSVLVDQDVTTAFVMVNGAAALPKAETGMVRPRTTFVATPKAAGLALVLKLFLWIDWPKANIGRSKNKVMSRFFIGLVPDL